MCPINFISSKEESDRDLPIIFLGGSSFIGLNTAQTLFYYYDFYCSYFNSQAPNLFPEFIWSRINFTDTGTYKKLLQNLIRKSKSKIIVNFIDIPFSENTNNASDYSKKVYIDLNSTIIDLCNQFDIYPVFISSDHVFSGYDGPYTEDMDQCPLKGSLFGNHKFAVEQLYQDNSNNYAIIRLSSILGINFHFQKEKLYSRVLSAVKNNKEVNAATNKFRTPSHVYNVSFLLHKMIEYLIDNKIPSKNIFHLPGEYISEFELFKEIAISHSCDENLIKPYEVKGDKNTEPLNLGLDSKKTVKLIKARFLSFKEGLQILNSDIESAVNYSNLNKE